MSRLFPFLFGRPFSHRGLHGPRRPENSMVAFEAAVQAGYAIELDVRVSADGQAVIFHDANLERMTESKGLVVDANAKALKNLNLGNSREGIPSLSDTLEMIAGRVPVIVEIKTCLDQVGLVEKAALPILHRYDGPFAVTAFDARTLAWFRKRQPELPRGHNVGTRYLSPYKPWWRRLAWEFLYDVDDAQPDFVVYDRRDLPNWATTRMRTSGMPVLSYTIGDMVEMIRLAPHTDNVIFEGFVP